MNWIKQNWFQLIIAICAVVFTVSVFDYFIVIPSLGRCERVFIFWKQHVKGCNGFNF